MILGLTCGNASRHASEGVSLGGGVVLVSGLRGRVR